MSSNLAHFLPSALLLASLASGLSPARAAELNVPGDFATIQIAMVVAQPGDTIVVAPGTYVGNVTFLGKSVTLKSAEGPEVTILDGAQSGSVVRFDNGEQGAVLEGFTLQNGIGTLVGGNRLGGGVYVAPGADVTLRGNRIVGNSATAGGGIYSESAVVISQNEVLSNDRDGIYLFQVPGAIEISQNTIASNESDGISVFGSGPLSELSITDNLIADNTFYGLIVLTCPTAVVRDNVCRDNDEDGILVRQVDDATVEDNDATGNGNFGIYVWQNGTTLVKNNVAVGNTENGFLVRDCSPAHVVGNTSGGNGDRGYFMWFCDDLRVESCIAAENGDHGITVRASTAVLSGFTSYRNAGRGINSSENISISVNNSISRGNPKGEIVVVLGGAIPVLDSCNIEGGYPGGTNIIDADPLFADADGPDDDPATFEDNDYRLLAGSPCIDAGGASSISCLALDLGGSPRYADGLLDGNLAMDMGAHEFNNVHLAVSGDLVAGGALDFTTSGAPSLSGVLAVNTSSAPLCVPSLGPVFPSLATPFLSTLGPAPAALSVPVPPSFLAGVTVHMQVAALGTGVGNMSNPVRLVSE